jgi:putative FmdB family regulatory protein
MSDMGILNDYRCADCGVRAEYWTERPAPSSLSCEACGGETRRLFSGVRLGGRAQAPEPPRAAAKPSMCSRYPMVPGLCHMSEDAGRMWVAKYTGDSRAIDREAEQQEVKAKEKPFVLEDAISHNHHHEPSPVMTEPAA